MLREIVNMQPHNIIYQGIRPLRSLRSLCDRLHLTSLVGMDLSQLQNPSYSSSNTLAASFQVRTRPGIDCNHRLKTISKREYFQVIGRRCVLFICYRGSYFLPYYLSRNARNLTTYMHHLYHLKIIMMFRLWVHAVVLTSADALKSTNDGSQRP